MSPSQAPEELRELLIELVDGQIGQDEADHLDSILLGHREAQDFYDRLMMLHGMLLWRYSPTLPGEDHALSGQRTDTVPYY